MLSIGLHIEFFVFDYDSLPYVLSLFFCSWETFPLVALDKIIISKIIDQIPSDFSLEKVFTSLLVLCQK